MKQFKHWIAHLFGWNKGQVVSFWLDDNCYIGFRCCGCGEINSGHIVFSSKKDTDHD